MEASGIRFDERGLLPCVMQDWRTGEVLTLAYMNAEALRLTRETVIVTEPYSPPRPASSARRLAQSVRRLFRRGRQPQGGEQLDGLQFLPDFRSGSPLDSWWRFSPQLITRFLGVFGFTDTAVSYHRANTSAGEQDLVTVVGRRTQGRAVGAAA